MIGVVCMKKTIILTESLTEEAFSALITLLETAKDNEFLLFKFAKERATLSGLISKYNMVIEKLEKSMLPYEFLEEDGLDEYFFLHKDEDEIYLTPTEAISQVISSASLMGYTGNLYVYGLDKSEPDVQNYRPHVRTFGYKRSLGTRGLNTQNASYNHVEGRTCTFSLNGQQYTEQIKGRNSTKSQGVEGFTQICESNPKYRLKIWDSPKKQYEIEKINEMLRFSNKNHNIGMPLAFVYNEQNNPIGFVMNNYDGEIFNIEILRSVSNPLKYVKQILEQLIFMETYGLLHRDVNHNILIDRVKEQIHIIDIDSIQFRQYPASASSVDPQNALPEKYETKSAFYNTIDIIYTGLTFLAASYVDVMELFGLWNTNGFCSLDQKLFNKLRVNSPDLAGMLLKAHTVGQPISIARQLSLVDTLINNTSTKALGILANQPECLNEYIDSVTYSDDKRQTRLCDFDSKLSDLTPMEEKYVNYNDKEIYCDESDVKVYSTKVNNTESSQNSAYNNTVSIDVKKSTQQKNYFSKIVSLIKNWILSIFMKGTVADGVTEDILWKTFISSGMWKKPLVSTLTATTAIVILTIAIFAL